MYATNKTALMKRLIVILLICLSLVAQGQTFSQWCRSNIISWSLMTCAGANNAVNNVLQHDYASFKATFPNAHDSYWNPDISWRNKYKNGDPEQGEAFWGSSTVFVGVTDGYHLTNCIRNNMVCAAFAFKIGDWKKRKWYYWVADFVSYSIAYGIGFNVTYEIIRK